MTGRDPLSALHSFEVHIKTILPLLYGYRMCPDCPHCVETACPCMDIYGSNATPMGGSAGRCDAIVGAVEAQKAEGVLHIHMYMYFQMASQHMSLLEIGDRLRAGLINVASVKNYVTNVRRAAYPSLHHFELERDSLETAWPAYALETKLCVAPDFAFTKCEPGSNCEHCSGTEEETSKDAAQWKHSYNTRLQYVMSRKNHHIHPVVNHATGERKPLASCRKKGKPNECKSGFPLDSEMTEEPLLVCSCIADWKGLC